MSIFNQSSIFNAFKKLQEYDNPAYSFILTDKTSHNNDSLMIDVDLYNPLEELIYELSAIKTGSNKFSSDDVFLFKETLNTIIINISNDHRTFFIAINC